MLLRFLLPIMFALALMGCASRERCDERQFFKAFVDGKPNPNRYFLDVAEISAEEDLTVRVSICIREDADALCVEVYPAEGVPFRFIDPWLTVVSEDGSSAIQLPIVRMSYNVACHGRSLQEEDAKCQSSTESPVIGLTAVSKTLSRAANIGGNYHYLNMYEFSPDATFKGAKVSAAFHSFRRKYEGVTKRFEPSKIDAITVALPKVVIGQKTLELPRVSFKYVTENVCLPFRRLSLQ